LKHGNPPGDFSKALQCGAKYVLVKPFKEDLLLERISNVLKG